jgi:microcompartment protein CcmL/EutN
MPAMSDTITALGFVEVRGFPAAIETADAMLKCAEVRLLKQLLRDPAQITLVVEGSLGACVAAVDAGKASAARMEALISSHVLGRPSHDTGRFVMTLHDQGHMPFGSVPAAPVLDDIAAASAEPEVVEPEDGLDARLLEIIGSMAGGCGATALIAKIGASPDIVRRRLNALRTAGKLLRKRGRYFLADGKEGETR